MDCTAAQDIAFDFRVPGPRKWETPTANSPATSSTSSRESSRITARNPRTSAIGVRGQIRPRHATPRYKSRDGRTDQSDRGSRRCEYGRGGHRSYLSSPAGHTRVAGYYWKDPSTTPGRVRPRQPASIRDPILGHRQGRSSPGGIIRIRRAWYPWRRQNSIKELEEKHLRATDETIRALQAALAATTERHVNDIIVQGLRRNTGTSS